MNKPKCSRPKQKKKKKPTYLFAAQGPFGRFFDRMMCPLMYWLQANQVEVPQRTHFWSWTRITEQLAHWMLEKDKMAPVAGDPKACKKSWFPFPRFCMPRFGGWNQYAVLTPSLKDWREGETWYVGCVSKKEVHVLRVPQTTSVRMMRGPDRVKFFALDRRHRQITVFATGFGETGKAPLNHATLPQH